MNRAVAFHLLPRCSAACLALGLLSVVSGCAGPSFIDEECIKGRLSTEQAEKINTGPWQHLPSYNQDDSGHHCRHCAVEGDRVLSAKCSQFIKEATFHRR